MGIIKGSKDTGGHIVGYELAPAAIEIHNLDELFEAVVNAHDQDIKVMLAGKHNGYSRTAGLVIKIIDWKITKDDIEPAQIPSEGTINEFDIT